ncbi:MAG: hypothetical protein GX950_03830 [Candidatus Diapherotrites archaeon]|jgi:hypothetical protein|uniref:HNH nuclease domain-containing protein n=1 Tax=Candidatus Iainarchaeum sp. TaxID=3101447 RepID=A0A7K4C0I3_9ARCH|nr:hypothetical protein [Candidatus Diapherotrites archaeon]
MILSKQLKTLEEALFLEELFMGFFHYDKKGYPRWNDSDKLVHKTVKHAGPGEVVHHKDGNKGNFRKSNLQVMGRSEHSKLHAKMKKWF